MVSFLIVILEVHVFVLLGVAFYTLMERKFMGIIQYRHGPSKVGLHGVMQPFSDAIKLISKSVSKPSVSSDWGFILSPIAGFYVSLVGWAIIPGFGITSFEMDLFWLFCFMSFTVYPVLYSGWFSNSKYSCIGSSRSIALSVSYEIPLSFSIFGVMLLSATPCFYSHVSSAASWGVWVCLPLAIVIILGLMVETGRPPFDLSEGESELVSGYTVEYGGGLYTLMFLGEYVSMFFSGMVISILFFSGNVSVILIYVSFAALVRASVPRFRFDHLMSLGWVVLTPLSLVSSLTIALVR